MWSYNPGWSYNSGCTCVLCGTTAHSFQLSCLTCVIVLVTESPAKRYESRPAPQSPVPDSPNSSVGSVSPAEPSVSSPATDTGIVTTTTTTTTTASGDNGNHKVRRGGWVLVVGKWDLTYPTDCLSGSSTNIAVDICVYSALENARWSCDVCKEFILLSCHQAVCTSGVTNML